MVATETAQVSHGDGGRKKRKTEEDGSIATTQLRLAPETEDERKS